MKRLFLFIFIILLTICTFRVLNGKESIGLKTIAETFSTYEFSFDTTHKLVLKVEKQFTEAKDHWDSVGENITVHFRGTLISKIINGLKVVTEYLGAIFEYIKTFFLCLGCVLTVVVDIILNAVNLFKLAMELLGFGLPVIE